MTPKELALRGIDAYNGGAFPRAECLFLMAILAERDVDDFEGIKITDLKTPEEKKPGV